MSICSACICAFIVLARLVLRYLMYITLPNASILELTVTCRTVTYIVMIITKW